MLPFLRTDVTAVCLHENLILAGIGASVSIYNKSTSAFLNKLKVLIGEKVHGFRPKANGTIAVHGGKQICIICVSRTADDADVSVTRVGDIQCDDWILHTLWMEGNSIALLTAHNVVQVWSASDSGWKERERYNSKNNSILYSGLLEPLADDLLVFAGTAFSEVIIQRCRSPEPLQTLEGHKGVIFSIAWDAVKEIIVTTSDDRSVRVWGPNATTRYSARHKEYWEQCSMVCKSAVYGHLSRVMKSTITESMIVSVGEDSHICFWDLSGKLLRKIRAHQNGCIWSVDSDSSHLVTGGSDAGVVLHPLTLATHNCQNDVLYTEEKLGTPKRIMFTARGNIVAYFTTDELQYFDVESKHWQVVALYDSTYKMIALSSCKQMLAIIDVNGNLDVFLENCKDAPVMKKFVFKRMDVGKICSLHWAGNRYLVISSEGGNVTVVASDSERLCSFHLPSCKERWLTAAAVSPGQHMFALGDRCGNIHFYHKEGKSPLETFRKVHGPYGPTTVTWKDRSVVTTGRDGTVKYFSINQFDTPGGVQVKMMHKVNLPFEWVERVIGGGDSLVCGFNERNFVVHNVRDGRSSIDVTCGGGHRAWDVRRYFQKVDNAFKELIQFTYVKDSSIHEATFDMDKIRSKTIVSGSHVKEVNCLKMLSLENNIGNREVLKEVFFIAGGEDTTIRISSCQPNWSDRLIFKQLSSIRSVAVQSLGSNEMLLVSGGGRANICVKVISFIRCDTNTSFSLEAENIVDFQVKGSDRERKGNTSWRSDIDLDPETRIMSLELVEANKKTFIILAGCSDSILRIFKCCHSQDTIFKSFGQINYHKTCILIVHQSQLDGYKICFTATTTGEVTVWDLGIFIENIEKDTLDLSEAQPILKLKVNRSGINSLTSSNSGGGLLLATGGDDNTVHLILLRLKEKDNLSSIFELSRWSTSSWHNAQVTGLKFSEDYLISASIDQRITVSRWSTREGAVACQYVDQLYTDVADVQGLATSSRDGDTLTICVYGKGIETIHFTIPQ